MVATPLGRSIFVGPSSFTKTKTSSVHAMPTTKSSVLSPPPKWQSVLIWLLSQFSSKWSLYAEVGRLELAVLVADGLGEVGYARDTYASGRRQRRTEAGGVAARGRRRRRPPGRPRP